MDLSRRRVLQGVVAMTVASATPLRWAGAAQAAPGAVVGTSWFSRSSYRHLVGTRFLAGSSAVLTLQAVGDLTPQPVKEKGNVADGRFSLIFTSSTVLSEGIRTFAHAALGTCPLFVSPVGPAGPVRSYEVIVNRVG